MGEAVNTVYFDGSLYTYVHEVIPSLNDNFALTTGFDVAGYTGTAGWSFSDAGAAGGSGTAMDFLILRSRPVAVCVAYRHFRRHIPGLGCGRIDQVLLCLHETASPRVLQPDRPRIRHSSRASLQRYQSLVRSPCSGPGSSVSMPRCAGAEACARSGPDSPIVGLSKSFL